jgi:hypothetical protein
LAATTGAAGLHTLYQTLLGIGGGTVRTLAVYGLAGPWRYLALVAGNNNASGNYITAIYDLGAGAGIATQTAVGGVGALSGTPTLVTGPNGFFRACLTGSFSATNVFIELGLAGAATGNTLDAYGQPNFTATGTEKVVIFGLSYEAGTSPSSYIPTAAAGVARAAESISGIVASGDLTVAFDDGSTQAVSVTDFVTAANLNRPTIAQIAA